MLTIRIYIYTHLYILLSIVKCKILARKLTNWESQTNTDDTNKELELAWRQLRVAQNRKMAFLNIPHRTSDPRNVIINHKNCRQYYVNHNKTLIGFSRIKSTYLFIIFWLQSDTNLENSLKTPQLVTSVSSSLKIQCFVSGWIRVLSPIWFQTLKTRIRISPLTNQ